MHSPLPPLLAGLVGKRPESISFSGASDWWLTFADDMSLYMPSLWRITKSGSLYASSEDHGQVFGLAEPYDARVPLRMLVGCSLLGVELSSETTDLSLRFAKQLVLQVLTTSLGYEGWSIVVSGRHRLVARGNELLHLTGDA
jgi:hypothetical protein